MHNKDLFKADGRCQESIKNNRGCAYCGGVKRCDMYPTDVPKAMAVFNGRWAAEWKSRNPEVVVKTNKGKHNPPNSRRSHDTKQANQSLGTQATDTI